MKQWVYQEQFPLTVCFGWFKFPKQDNGMILRVTLTASLCENACKSRNFCSEAREGYGCKQLWGSAFFDFYLSPCLFIKLCSISCHCNQCRFNRFQSKLHEKQIGRQINGVIMQIFAYVSRSYCSGLNEIMDLMPIWLLMRILLIIPQ